MSDDKSRSVKQVSLIHRAGGVTTSERYLKRLCDHSFLSLWSYPGIYRDQGGGKAGNGKEVCDLLVVFENHIIIFSDKDCEFPNTGNLEVDWSRWFRRAIHKSAKQVWGAERWIKSYPGRLFLDRACTTPFPIDLPDPATAIFHRIVVAHGVSRRCWKELGGSGSLMIDSSLIGAMHYISAKDGGRSFTVGQIDPAKGYVHVFDDTSLAIVMNTLDTVTDFLVYLTKKEKFICNSGLDILAAGEEDLLAFYLGQLNEEGEHDFIIPPNIGWGFVAEGHWEEFLHSPQRQAQLSANQVSYAWDALIEAFNRHILADTQYYTTHPGLAASEKILRFLARESRTRRRLLARSLLELIDKTPRSYRAIRAVLPSKTGDPYYVFLLLPHLEGVRYAEYREVRRKLLEACCLVTKLEFPEAQDIVGIATETGTNAAGSEDVMYYDARAWTAEEQAEAQSLQEDLGLLCETTMFASKEYEYPINT
jgi:hypothetical protein